MRTMMALLALLALAGGFGACGGGSGEKAATRASATTTGDRAPSKGPSCAAKGIDRTHLKEGTCTAGGVRMVVANHTSELRLRTLAVAIKNIAAATKRGNATATGTYVVLTLSVRNLTGQSQRFAGETRQIALTIGEAHFGESLEAESSSDPRSFAAEGRTVEPHATRTGEVVFDVPTARAKELPKSGRLFVANWNESFAEGSPKEVGQFRLYH